MFKLTKIELGRINVPEPEYLPVGATAVVPGEVLVLSSGKLVKPANGYTKPDFVALAAGAANATEVAVGRITPEMLFEVGLDTGDTMPAVGAIVQVDATGLLITDETNGGVATIVKVIDTDKAVVRFDKVAEYSAGTV